MHIEIQIDESLTEPHVLIRTDKVTQELSALIQSLSEDRPEVLAGFSGDTAALLKQEDIVRIYASDGKVFAETDGGDYQLRLRLYELENRLDKKTFVRISNSEIINLKKVKGFDLRFSGTICVSLVGGTTTYVSRRYVAKIKQVLGV